MKFAQSMAKARARILEQGIQQTNRYFFRRGSGPIEYPYSVVLPGYGYDLMDHSIWSVIRKIPFRKTYTDLQVTFIVGSNNYKSYLNEWQSMITSPEPTISPVPTTASQVLSGLKDFAIKNGVSSSNIETNNADGKVYGGGGAVNYLDKIYTNFVYFGLLKETGTNDLNAYFTFNEAFISQIAPIQLTSVETGYSTFQVNYKFASMIVS